MSTALRQATILRQVRDRGGVRQRELIRSLRVSPSTIRRDLDTLAQRGLVDRVHGGAVPAGPPVSTVDSGRGPDPDPARAERAAIAEIAAGLVEPGATVGITAGATAGFVARRLARRAPLTVVTNCLEVAAAFDRRHLVVVTGGVREPSGALVDPLAGLPGLVLDRLFLDVHGMNPEFGLTAASLPEAGTHRLFLAAARRVTVVADHRRWDRTGIGRIGPLSLVDTVVTGAALPPDGWAALRAAGVRLLPVDSR